MLFSVFSECRGVLVKWFQILGKYIKVFAKIEFDLWIVLKTNVIDRV